MSISTIYESQKSDTIAFEYKNNKINNVRYSYETQNTDLNNQTTKLIKNVLISYFYNDDGSLRMRLNTFNGGQFEDSTVYLYNASCKLVEEKNYTPKYTYTKKYEYNVSQLCARSIGYDGNGAISYKEEYQYNTEELCIKTEKYCWNYTEYNLQGSTETEWVKVKIIKFKDSNNSQLVATGLNKKISNKFSQNTNNLNDIALIKTIEKLEQAGKFGIVKALKCNLL
jgi:hypothetical protein